MHIRSITVLGANIVVSNVDFVLSSYKGEVNALIDRFKYHSSEWNTDGGDKMEIPLQEVTITQQSIVGWLTLEMI